MKIPPEVFEAVASELVALPLDEEDLAALIALFNGSETGRKLVEIVAEYALRSYMEGAVKAQGAGADLFAFGLRAGWMMRGRVAEESLLEELGLGLRGRP